VSAAARTLIRSTERRHDVRGFGDLEAAVMDRLWSWRRSATVREVFEDLRSHRKIAYTTVMTVMDTLHSKGWLRRHLDGRAYRYEPVATREQYSADLMREALDASHDPGTTLVHFLDQVTEAESEALRRELRRRRGRSR
jgi:predicted transcriptional regulator